MLSCFIQQFSYSLIFSWVASGIVITPSWCSLTAYFISNHMLKGTLFAHDLFFTRLKGSAKRTAGKFSWILFDSKSLKDFVKLTFDFKTLEWLNHNENENYYKWIIMSFNLWRNAHFIIASWRGKTHVTSQKKKILKINLIPNNCIVKIV